MPVSAFRRAVLLVPALLTAAMAQLSYKESSNASRAQRALPSTGPGSALFNPAALSETRLAHAQFGIYSSLSGISGETFLQGSAAMQPERIPGMPVGVAAGLGYSTNDSKIDGSNAVYRNSLYSPAAALFLKPELNRNVLVAAGLSLPIHEFNAFGAVKSWSSGLSLGLLGIYEEHHGQFRLGFAYHNLVAPKVRLPDNRGHYNIPGWMDFTYGWSSPGRMVRMQWESYLLEPIPASEGPSQDQSMFWIGAWELEVRPHPWVGLKLERPRLGMMTCLGLILNPDLGPRVGELFMELNFGHDKLLPPPPEWLFGIRREEGLGLLTGFTLGYGI